MTLAIPVPDWARFALRFSIAGLMFAVGGCSAEKGDPEISVETGSGPGGPGNGGIPDNADAEVKAPGPTGISVRRMRTAVEFLTDPSLRGRKTGTAESLRTAAWIAEAFEKIGLLPLVNGSYFHDFRHRIGSGEGRNVAGIVRAPSRADGVEEFVVVGAHFDGVGDTENAHYPAADDNASGVSAMMEIARATLAQKNTLRRSVVFVSYDAEEQGLLGSTKFVQDEIIPEEDTRFMLVFDLIGGKFFPWQKKSVIAMGTEHSNHLRRVVDRLAPDRPTPIERLGTYVLEPAGPLFARSDYRAYRQAKIPYVFFSTGTPWYYHMPGDGIQNIDFRQCAEIAKFALDLVLDIARDDQDIDFINRPKAEVHDLAQLHRVLGEILDHRTEIHLPDKKFDQLEKMHTALTRAIAKNKPNRALAHRALIQLFEAAKNSQPQK